jgi:hypothetical protein
MSGYVSDAVRKRVRQAARDRCGYCLSHQRYLLGPLEIEHFVPRVRGGSGGRGAHHRVPSAFMMVCGVLEEPTAASGELHRPRALRGADPTRPFLDDLRLDFRRGSWARRVELGVRFAASLQQCVLELLEEPVLPALFAAQEQVQAERHRDDGDDGGKDFGLIHRNPTSRTKMTA